MDMRQYMTRAMIRSNHQLYCFNENIWRFFYGMKLSKIYNTQDDIYLPRSNLFT